MTVVEGSAGLAAAVERARAGSRSGRAILERLAVGGEVTVNGFCRDGTHHVAAITDREHFPAAFGVARCHIYPAADPDGAEAAATAAVAAVGITEGPTYVQVVVTPDGPQVMEVAARLGGGHDSELIRLTTGVDLARCAVEAALGRAGRRGGPAAAPTGGRSDRIPAGAGRDAGADGRARPASASIMPPDTCTASSRSQPTARDTCCAPRPPGRKPCSR